jgi:hypothetical protein
MTTPQRSQDVNMEVKLLSSIRDVRMAKGKCSMLLMSYSCMTC